MFEHSCSQCGDAEYEFGEGTECRVCGQELCPDCANRNSAFTDAICDMCYDEEQIEAESDDSNR